MRIAHLSDLHILDLHGVRPRAFLSRRILGGVNLITARRGGYSATVLERALEDLLDVDPDHVVITGDLSNLALEGEFERVAAYLRYLWESDRVSVVPGNHDYYTAGAIKERRFEKSFYPYMFPEFSDLDVALYPYVKHLGPVTIYGFCSATLPPPGFAFGHVEPEQLHRFERLARDRSTRATFRIALIHHHFYTRRGLSGRTSGLRNNHEVRRVLMENGIDLVLHGHDHTAHVEWLEGAERRIPAIGSGSSTATDPDPAKTARYNVYTIRNRRLVQVDVRRYDLDERRFKLAEDASPLQTALRTAGD